MEYPPGFSPQLCKKCVPIDEVVVEGLLGDAGTLYDDIDGDFLRIELAKQVETYSQ
jgi:hypothetical protein